MTYRITRERTYDLVNVVELSLTHRTTRERMTLLVSDVPRLTDGIAADLALALFDHASHVASTRTLNDRERATFVRSRAVRHASMRITVDHVVGDDGTDRVDMSYQAPTAGGTIGPARNVLVDTLAGVRGTLPEREA